jgi:hypothetical protein
MLAAPSVVKLPVRSIFLVLRDQRLDAADKAFVNDLFEWHGAENDQSCLFG